MALADRVVVVEDGRVVQTGTPADVSRHPRTDYVARLVGLSLLPGTGDGRSVRLDGGGEVAVAEDAAGPVFAAVRPESVALYLARPEGSPRNVWPATLVGATPHGATVRCELAGEVPLIADVTATAFAELGLVPGSPRVGDGEGLRGRRLRALRGWAGELTDRRRRRPRRRGRPPLRHAQGAGRVRGQPPGRAGGADGAGGLRPGPRRAGRAGRRRLAAGRPRRVRRARQQGLGDRDGLLPAHRPGGAARLAGPGRRGADHAGGHAGHDAGGPGEGAPRGIARTRWRSRPTTASAAIRCCWAATTGPG